MNTRAVLFDCDGVLVDSEPAHYEAFRVTLAAEGLPLTREEYFRRYLAYDDATFFTMVHAHHQVPLDDSSRDRLVREKSARLAGLLADLPVMEESFAFARQALAAGCAVAVASGSHRHEVRSVLVRGGLPDLEVVVATEDVDRGKPCPDPWLLALLRLNESRKERIRPEECIAIEDSLHGVQSVLAAGMRVVGLTTSYGADDLAAAHLVLPGLGGVTVAEVERMLDSPRGGGA
jgi:beta-phosphoglucomutase